MKKLVCILLIFIAYYVKAQTYPINGTVTDEKGATVRGATVFITNSKYVTSTDNAGKFSFNKLQSGSYEVVVKMVGFIPVTQSVIVQEKPVYLSIRLKASNAILNSVTIRGRPDPKREEYLAQFIKNFIGETANARQCKVLNPEVLNFHYNKTTKFLTASADDFIVVENKALGYRIKYLLTEFELDINNYICSIIGSPYFEDLKGTAAEQKKWANNRRITYLSSSRHFFRAVMNNTTNAEGYLVYQIINDPAIISAMHKGSPAEIIEFNQTTPAGKIKRYAVKISDVNSLFIDDKKNFKTLKKDVARLELFIIYMGQKQSPLFYKTGQSYNLPIPFPAKQRRNMQVSQLTSLMDVVTIDRNYEWLAKGFRYSGYWSWLRAADLIPIDYF
ncbi:carboxypeptidase-like regulatory domain-containing protein [Mucilaginibacter sp.]|uniref:carboxypeptidase-like regulatory domain-containing protein n=1 Tax=Mucilaginibacter sp. TaxID=1882438 RepID=UPI002618520A|nr:carboxypeptidase-like regulatory domain-containing protein [Mucilaginibacter sp.]MDB5029840.1 hypothetical protein [Mucilaginibacter sp.]